jgi:hypothetical protein
MGMYCGLGGENGTEKLDAALNWYEKEMGCVPTLPLL